jgi:hypothetical protein
MTDANTVSRATEIVNRAATVAGASEIMAAHPDLRAALVREIVAAMHEDARSLRISLQSKLAETHIEITNASKSLSQVRAILEAMTSDRLTQEQTRIIDEEIRKTLGISSTEQ